MSLIKTRCWTQLEGPTNWVLTTGSRLSSMRRLPFLLLCTGSRRFSNEAILRLTKRTFPQALRNWFAHKADVLQSVSVTFFTERKAHSREALSKIKCPVRLIHGEADIAYPISYSEKFLSNLLSAGVDAKLDIIPGAPHFASVTHANWYVLLFSFKDYIADGLRKV
jgi:pimeloyl-ACP methyl ester carboxylesterase